MRKSFALAGAGGLLLIAASWPHAALASREDGSVSPTPETQPSASPSQPADAIPVANALAAVSSHLDSDIFANISVGNPPGDFKSGSWVYLVVNKTTEPDNHNQLLAVWEADLLKGAAARSMADSQTQSLSDVIAGDSIGILNPNGSVTDAGAVASGQISPQHVFSAPADAEAIADVKNEVQTLGMEPLDVRVLHPLGSALYVTAQVPDQDAVQNFGTLMLALQGDWTTYTGIYLELRDATGQTLIASGTSYWSGSGHLWMSPSLTVDPGVPHG